MKRVALLIETSREYGRGLLRGIIRYQREHEPWSLYFQPKGLNEMPPVWLKDWKGDGILVRADNRPLACAVIRSKIPAVELRLGFPDVALPAVGIDNRASVELAFAHLLERGFNTFAYCGLGEGTNIWSDFRGDCFVELATKAGGRCFRHPDPTKRLKRTNWDQQQQELTRWLAALPRPVGVLAFNDDRGLQVLDACRRAGIVVPDEAAVIGVDNDEFLCNLSTPPLSSVDIGVDRAGYEAAALLERLMAGEKNSAQRIFLMPIGVVIRQSTDVVSIPDRDLADAIRFIRKHACEAIRVDDVLKRYPLSHSTLQRRFKAVIGRTLKEEITRVQLDRARHLLAHTDLLLGEVAARCGFGQLKRFSTVFRAKEGMPPGAFRRGVKLG